VSGEPARLGIVTGLRFEARIVRTAATALHRAPPLLACAGPGFDRARTAALDLIGQGATHLLSFGVAGGLDPALGAGSTIVATRFVRADGSSLAGDAAWGQQLAHGLAGTRLGDVADSFSVLVDAASKSALFAATKASIADMESYGIATAAVEKGVSCAAIRVVSDRAQHGMPSSALKGMNPDGSVNGFGSLLEILLKPWQLPALIRMAEGTRIAQKRLYTLADAGLARGFFTGLIDQ